MRPEAVYRVSLSFAGQRNRYVTGDSIPRKYGVARHDEKSLIAGVICFRTLCLL